MEIVKKVLGLDLGTNSIGHALVVKKYTVDETGEVNPLPASIEIAEANSRIVPPRSEAKDALGDFAKGKKQESTAKARRGFRSMRRRFARFVLRRERLFRVLHELSWLPEHFDAALDFEKYLGRFKVQLDKSAKTSPADKTVEAPKMQWCGNDFVFKSAFDEMVEDFGVPAGKKISHDWLIYFLRDKALREKLTNEELAFVISSFNSKRGYYQRGRSEEESKDDHKKIYTICPKVKVNRDLTDDDDLPKGKKNVNAVIEFDCSSNLTDADGNAKSFCLYFDKFRNRGLAELRPGTIVQNVVASETFEENDDGKEILKSAGCTIDAWLYKKTFAAESLDKNNKTLGSTIKNLLKESLGNDIRIVGGIFGTIERRYYVDELRKILNAQAQWHPELTDAGVLKKVAAALYPKNIDHQKQRTGKKRTLIDFIIEDVVFYQRPLKTKKSLIDKCELESTKEIERPCAAVSNPYAQEFRVLQFISNLKIRDSRDNSDYTNTLFLRTPEQYQMLFDLLINKRELTLGKGFARDLIKIAKSDVDGKIVLHKDEIEKCSEFIITNFDEMKKMKLNATRGAFIKHFKKIGIFPLPLSREQEYALWHLCYSVSDPTELEKGLKKFAEKNADIFKGTTTVPEDFVAEFKNIEPFEEGYSAHSEKALKKLLPLMRPTLVWESVPAAAQKRIDEFLNFDKETSEPEVIEEHEKMRAFLLKQQKVGVLSRDDFCCLQPWLAKHLVYGAQLADSGEKWSCGNDIRDFISNKDKNGFRAGSLRNPLVEAISLETLRVVADYLDKYESIDEIHIELGRELNASADQRKGMDERNKKNEKNRKSAEEECRKFVKDHRSCEKLSKLVERYLLWKEQGERDPYVEDRTINLSEALNGEKYQIDHIIPYSKYNNNSRDNKVLTAAAVNKAKSNRTGLQFVEEMNGGSVDGNKIYDINGYRENVFKFCWRNLKKQKLLLSKDIPEGFSSAQLNDTRYITKFIATQLSKLVRGNINDAGALSKNIIIVSGGISSRLKEDWGLGNSASGVWNNLMRERVRAVYGNAQPNDDGTFTNGVDAEGKCHIDENKTDKTGQGGLKRIDHRHHALDAIVIAACDRRHVQYLNNESAGHELRNKSLILSDEKDEKRRIKPPCEDFAKLVKDALKNKVVSVKGNNRVLMRNVSYVASYQGRKKIYKHNIQTGFVVRRRLHEDTYWGMVDENKVSLRIPLESFGMAKTESDKKSILKKIDNCNDMVVKFVIKRHLSNKGGDFLEAFSPNGIEEMNAEIARCGNTLTPKGNPHKAIKYLHIVDSIGAGFAVSKSKFKPTKIAYNAKGGNLAYVCFLKNNKWDFEVIDLRQSISLAQRNNRLNLEKNLTLDKNGGKDFIFAVRPDDLIYWPENQTEIPVCENLEKDRIFKVRKFASNGLFVDPINVSKPLSKKEVELYIPKAQKFYPIEIDRLGNIKEIKTDFLKNGG